MGVVVAVAASERDHARIVGCGGLLQRERAPRLDVGEHRGGGERHMVVGPGEEAPERCRPSEEAGVQGYREGSGDLVGEVASCELCLLEGDEGVDPGLLGERLDAQAEDDAGDAVVVDGVLDGVVAAAERLRGRREVEALRSERRIDRRGVEGAVRIGGAEAERVDLARFERAVLAPDELGDGAVGFEREREAEVGEAGDHDEREGDEGGAQLRSWHT